MAKEFNLSDKVRHCGCCWSYKDIKEFIKRLKNSLIDLNLNYEQRQLFIKNLDDLAGDKFK